MSIKSPDLNAAGLSDLCPHLPGLEHLSIIYVGSSERGEALKTLFGACGAHLWPAHEVQEALAFYVFYMPDLVILDDLGADDGSSTLADEVYEHLESVGAAPLLVLAASRLEVWEGRLTDSSLVLSSGGSDAALLGAAAELTARHRSAFRARPAAR